METFLMRSGKALKAQGRRKKEKLRRDCGNWREKSNQETRNPRKGLCETRSQRSDISPSGSREPRDSTLSFCFQRNMVGHELAQVELLTRVVDVDPD